MADVPCNTRFCDLTFHFVITEYFIKLRHTYLLTQEEHVLKYALIDTHIY